MSNSHQPATFLERGVSVPFTAPTLAGTRVRPNGQGGLDLLVPNLAGGRGAYVIPWGGIAAICKPTLHDTRLMQRIADLSGIAPATIRQAAQATVAEGYAGRSAAAAANAAIQADAQAELNTNFELLVRLVRQTEPDAPDPCALPPAEMEVLAKHTIARLASTLGREAETIATALEALAALFSPVGLTAGLRQPRLAAGMGALGHFRETVCRLPPGDDDGQFELASVASRSADLTLACARRAMAEARLQAGDPCALLRAWFTTPARVVAELSRLDWLMDGWERVCLIWADATGPQAPIAALTEIAALLPVIPAEAAAWAGVTVDTVRPRPPRSRDGRDGAALPQDMVARNERLCARAA